MSDKEKYLADYTIQADHERIFDLIPSNKKQYFITLSLLGLILIGLILLVVFAGMNIGMLIYAVLMSVFVIFITPFLWHQMFKRFIKLDLVPAMEMYKKDIETKNFISIMKANLGKFLGWHFRPEYTYYIEAEPHDLDLTDTPLFLKRYAFDITTTAIGFSFLITMIISWFISVSANNWYVLLYIGIGLAFASPIIVSPLVPIMWTLEDAAVKVIDEHHKIMRFGLKLKQRIVDRFIGKGGIIFGFSTILNQVSKYNEETAQFTSFEQFLWTSLIFIAISLMMGLPGLLSIMRYFRIHHEENVNLTRNILKTVLPIGYTVVRAERNS